MSKKFIAFVYFRGRYDVQYKNVVTIGREDTTFILTLENGKTVIVPKKCTIIEEQ